jgi:3-mercaptopyruvate sulfurtransferase SseA
MILAPRIDPATAKAKLDSGEAVALDVTSSLVYPAVGHKIPGAIRIPPEPIIRGLQAARPAAEIARYFESLPPDREIIAYCT